MSFVRSLGRFGGTVVFTIVETVTLGVWLALVQDAPTVSTLAAIGAAVLVVGLFVEALVNTVVVNGFGDFPLGNITVFSVTEAAIWIVWLVAAEQLGGLTGVGVAGVLLFVLMLPQHSIEDNVLRGRPLFSDVLAPGTALFTFVEAAGATVWLAFVFQGEQLLANVGVGIDTVPVLSTFLPELGAAVGLLVLGVALLVEHVMGVQFALRGGEPAAGV
jgi:hypothetical protein